ncbi:ribosome silencing factor [Psychromonas algicola]|uniref:ribosome silencing factor n=1 Tax=Psychromonas algicola TaxID=2555642 RepID=UPI001068497A|nr:ribosome silencing factor [Psychromonas sp. RZ5]TEW51349.1 ribosome silencing factor [Psychromonas sp. RZ5]
MQDEQLKAFIINQLEEMKAKEIVTIDVAGISDITDTLIICTGTSKRHVRSIGEQTALAAKNAGEVPLGVEGLEGSEWVLIDMGNVVVHVMQDETRQFYQLEKLWTESV